MKKIIATLVISALVLTTLPVNAFAHGHSTSKTSTKTVLCSIENCNVTGTHKHNGTSYSGHTTKDGHSYHNSNASGVHH